MFFPKNANTFFNKYVLFSSILEIEKTKWKNIYIKLIKKISYTNLGKQIILKNPVNTGRINVILEMFPNAKFIHIYRNPYDVYCSTKNLYKKLLPTCQLQTISDSEIEKLILENYKLQLTKFFADKTLISKENIVDIRFEDLEKTPLHELEKIYDKLNLYGFRLQKINIIQFLNKIGSYQKNEFKLTISDIKTVNDHWGFAFEQFQYSKQKISNTVYYSNCHICEKQICIEYITALTILNFKTTFYMRHFEEELV